MNIPRTLLRQLRNEMRSADYMQIEDVLRYQIDKELENSDEDEDALKEQNTRLVKALELGGREGMRQTLRKCFFMFCIGVAIGCFFTGMWKFDPVHLSLAFVFLGLAWLYREMDLGWSNETKGWKFIPWGTHIRSLK